MSEVSAHDLTPEELKVKLADPMWRMSNLYRIIVKGDDDTDGLVIQFKPNRAQRRFIQRLWHRNIILKARQLGFTTLICIAWLDHALFNANSRCGIIAQDRETAEAIFTDKVKFAYDNLPEILRATMPLSKCTTSELRFAHNNSMMRVATSVRGGTYHRLHVSEFGKICAKFPDKAKEVVTGSIPAVPLSGVLVIESTAEGREGEFYDMTQRAIGLAQAKKPLTPRDYRFHFFAWWDEPQYRMPAGSVIVTEKDHAYFAAVEAEMGCTIEPEQRAWYVGTRDADFPGKPERMWQEYPSTPDEAFQQSTEGTYFKDQIIRARTEQRFTTVPWVQASPVNTFWDLGLNDHMTIWFHQHIGAQHRFIRYYENAGEAFAHYWNEMNRHGYVWGNHYLPHDADARRLGVAQNKTPREMLEELGMRNIVVVPRTESKLAAIQQARDVFGQCWFDETGCKDGIIHLEMYRKEWNDRLAVWKDTPRHDVHSNGADSFMQFAQGYKIRPDHKPMSAVRKNKSWRRT